MDHLSPPLSQGIGYAIVVGLGAVFAIGMVMTTYILRRYQREVITAEEFATAGRTVKTGLIASAVVSSWTWAATLLQSTTMAYKVGVSGPFYYAAGACVQIILFSTLAIKCKQRAPNAHTFLEIIRARYGRKAHIVHMCYALVTNILVTTMLLTGGSAVVSELTGMHTAAACFLLPVGVIIYTLFGGIKATFLTDYVHTVIIIVIILTFTFSVYRTSDVLGSASRVYDLLREAAKQHPVEGNRNGEYLTMKSESGGIFFVIGLVGNFGTVLLDNGYFTKAFSSSPAAALPGYVVGGIVWFAIPCLVATSLGLACLALEMLPSFPNYPERLSPEQVNAGLVLPVAAFNLLGKGGAMAALLMVFMAVTSAMSAELIAVSTIFTYDIYRGYVNPNAPGKRLIVTSHAACVIFGVAMSALSVGLYYAGISLGYLYEVMGIIISSAVLPSALTLFWSKQNIYAVTIAPLVGTSLAVISWLVCTKALYGSITVENTYKDYPMLTGNLVALLSPALLIPLLTYALGSENFDWVAMKTNILRVDETDELLDADKELARVVTRELFESPSVHSVNEKEEVIRSAEPKSQHEMSRELEEERILKRASKLATILCCLFILSFLVLWPVPMYGTGYIFSKGFFIAWVSVLTLWIFCTGFAVCIYPLWEGRHGLFTTFRGIYWDCTGQTSKLRDWQCSQI
ncbi:AaceriABR043Wp [[Ashbya] aceris (nom. inval.)]|nr:AaceriABR043Wp [[Ashbya] aceris (nom. inval.)]